MVGETSGQHYCQQHEIYHCMKHWRVCCRRFGYSVMVRRPYSLEKLKQRAQEIMDYEAVEIRKYDIWIEQMRTRRFVCSECRLPVCECDMSKFKVYEDKNNTNNNKKYRRRKKTPSLVEQDFRQNEEELQRLA